jgi:hypothetical protein
MTSSGTALRYDTGPMKDLKAAARVVAEEMKSAGPGPLPPDLRRRFLDVRTALFRRGMYDPILARFDSATVPQATAAEVAERLGVLIAAL